VLIFHIAEPADWEAARDAGTFTRSTRGQSLDEVGFIHCSQPHQVKGVLDAFYADIDHDLVLLVIDTDRLTSPWQLDDVPGAADPFPHVNGPLDIDAVAETLPLRRSPEGFVLPVLPR
jgi:glutathione S-transferase